MPCFCVQVDVSTGGSVPKAEQENEENVAAKANVASGKAVGLDIAHGTASIMDAA